MDEAEHGVIYISFGSMLSTNTIPKDKLDAIVGAISELPQRFIWKWESDTLPGNPKNVYLSNWLPQNDILGKLRLTLLKLYKLSSDILFERNLFVC